MIWATIRPYSCFCWLYRASLYLAAKDTVGLSLALTLWWCSRVESSLPLLERVFSVTSMFSWQSCQPLPCFALHSKAKQACCSRYLTSYFCIPFGYYYTILFYLFLFYFFFFYNWDFIGCFEDHYTDISICTQFFIYVPEI